MRYEDEEPPASIWDQMFGGDRPQNRAERRKAEKELASRVRRSLRAKARREKKEAADEQR